MTSKERLTNVLEPVLRERDPRPRVSAYHNLPYAIFQYEAENEFEMRREIAKLRTRLELTGKRVTIISLAECMAESLAAVGVSAEMLADGETNAGADALIDTLAQILASDAPLDAIVATRVPTDAKPEEDVVFLTRAGSLFPFYRTSALLERMMGNVSIPAVLFFPGRREGPAGLSFMGVLDADHHYRARIF
jgi:hypothetical protein